MNDILQLDGIRSYLSAKETITELFQEESQK
jgi:hypothetical protein